MYSIEVHFDILKEARKDVERVDSRVEAMKESSSTLALWLCEDPSHFNALECLRQISDLCDDIKRLRLLIDI